MENLKKIKINKKRNIKKYLVIIFSLLLSLSLFTCGVVKDTKPPEVVSVNFPANYQLNNKVVVVSFSEPIKDPVQSKFVVTTGNSIGTQTDSQTISSLSISNDNHVYITLGNEIRNGNYVRVVVDDQAVLDEAGNAVRRTILNPLRSYIDNEGPLVNGLKAKVTSTVANQVIVSFDEEVQSVVPSKFRVFTGIYPDPGNINTPNLVTGAQKNPDNSKQVILTVQNNLNPGEYVRVEIDSGAVQDNLGNNAPVQSSSTNPPILVPSTQVKQEDGSGDNIHPTIVNWEITANSNEIFFTFSEAVKEADASKVHVTQGTSGNVNQNNTVESAQVLADNNHMVKVTFVNTFPGGNYVKYSIDEGFVKDLNNNLIQATDSTSDKQVISSVVYIRDFFQISVGVYSVSSLNKNIEVGDSEFIVPFTKAVKSYEEADIFFGVIDNNEAYQYKTISHISLQDNGLSMKISLKDYQLPNNGDTVKGVVVQFHKGALTFTTNEKNYYQGFTKTWIF